MKIDLPWISQTTIESGLLEFTRDKADIGLGQTKGVLCFGLTESVKKAFRWIPESAASRTATFINAPQRSYESSLVEFTRDKADIGLGQTKGVLVFGLTESIGKSHLVAQPKTNDPFAMVRLWAAALLG